MITKKYLFSILLRDLTRITYKNYLNIEINIKKLIID